MAWSRLSRACKGGGGKEGGEHFGCWGLGHTDRRVRAAAAKLVPHGAVASLPPMSPNQCSAVISCLADHSNYLPQSITYKQHCSPRHPDLRVRPVPPVQLDVADHPQGYQGPKRGHGGCGTVLNQQADDGCGIRWKGKAGAAVRVGWQRQRRQGRPAATTSTAIVAHDRPIPKSSAATVLCLLCPARL